MRTVSLLTAALLLATAGDLLAAVSKSERFVQKWNAPSSTLVIENPIGNVEIYGTDDTMITATVVKNVTGADARAIEEGRHLTQVGATGDDNIRVLRTVLPPIRSNRWTSSVSWVIRVPRTVHIRVASNTSERIRISGIRANVIVKNFSGTVLLDNLGATIVESVNGSIVYDAGKPFANARLSSINGDIHVIVAPDANLRWIADTIKGDYRTTMPVRGNLIGSVLRASVNAPGGPIVETLSMMGQIFLLRKNTTAAQAQSVRTMRESIGQTQAVSRGEATRHNIVQGRFAYQTSLGNVSVAEVRGEAVIHTGAGEVNIGAVLGACEVTSGGGPLNLGEMFGPVSARTRAGDITVDAAREGGTFTTEGGTIRLMYNAGPVRLFSGGGDIIVRQAAGPVIAEAKSGDVTISVDPEARSHSIDAKTFKGNVTLQVPRQFRGDVVATVTSSDPAHTIRSSIPGLTIRREQVGGKTIVSATGKLNGGGERIELRAENGSIVIGARAASGANASPR